MLTPFPLHTQSSTHVFHCTELQRRFTGQRERIRSQAGQTREEISTIGELACWGMRKALIHINRGPLSLAVAHKSFPWSRNKSPCGPRAVSPFFPFCTSFVSLAGGQWNVLRRQEAGRRKTKAWVTPGVGNRPCCEQPLLGVLVACVLGWHTHTHTFCKVTHTLSAQVTHTWTFC